MRWEIIMDLQSEKQNLVQLFDEIQSQVDNYKLQIENLNKENSNLKQSSSPITDNQLISELELLKYKNSELESVLQSTKNRIGELSTILIEKETQIKELKSNQPKRNSNFDIGESDQLFEAKMAVMEKDKQIQQLQKQISKYQANSSVDPLQLQIEVEQLHAENERLSSENSKLKQQINIPSPTVELREIDSLLDEIAEFELSNQQLEPTINIAELDEFEFTTKAKLALKLLANGGLYRDQFKKELMHEREIIDSFIGEVNGYFEDQYYFELIVENKNHYTINTELFE